MADAAASSMISLLPSPHHHLNPRPSFNFLLRRTPTPPSFLSFSLKLPWHSDNPLYCSPLSISFAVSHSSELQSVLEEPAGTATTAEEVEVYNKGKDETLDSNRTRTLYVVNLPYSTSSTEIKNLFEQCGTVKRVHVASKEGKNKGFAFVTMGTREEADAAVENFNSTDFSGRTILVEYVNDAKNLEPLKIYRVYVSNLNWKVRPKHLREFFSANFKPRSARVIFHSDSGKSAGYGFVYFDSKEDAEAAISSLDGKELMGKEIVLRYGDSSSEPGKKDKQNDSMDESGEERVQEVTGTLVPGQC